jgi:hypothetical protein
MRRTLLLGAVVAALVLPSPALAAGDWSWPVRGQVVTPYRNGDDPYAAGQHRGIDIEAPVGTPVSAAASGRVTYAGVAGSSGLTVSVRTGDGRFDLSYLHLSAASVKEGDQVERGDRLGAVGTSGRRSTDAPHLHFGVRQAGSATAYRDPLDFLPPLPPPATQPESPAAAPAHAPQTAPPAAAPVRTAGPVAAPAGSPVPGPVAAPVPAPGAVSAPHVAGADGALDARGVRQPHAGTVASRGATGAHAAPAAGHEFQGVHSGATSAGARARAVAGHAGGAAREATPPPGAGALGPAPSSRAAATPPVSRVRSAIHAPGSSGGVDLGWLAALIGTVLAATCLGAPDRSRRAARSGRAAVAGLMRPLLVPPR